MCNSRANNKACSNQTNHKAHQQQPASFQVIDPVNRTGKIEIPAKYIFPTLGRRQYLAQHSGNNDNATANPAHPQDWTVRTKADYSLCLLFLQGRCKASNQCRQLHADPNFVKSVRANAAGRSTCCAKCGDARAEDHSFQQKIASVKRFTLVLSRTDRRSLPISVLGNTQAVGKAIDNNPKHKLFVERSRICRLHLQNKCSFGCDCKNFHLCRDVHKAITSKKSEEPHQFIFTFPNAPKAQQEKKHHKVAVDRVATQNVPKLVVVPPTAPAHHTIFKVETSPRDSESSAASSIGSCTSTEAPTPREDGHRRNSLDRVELSHRLQYFAAAFQPPQHAM